jgi:hypothetical protein
LPDSGRGLNPCLKAKVHALWTEEKIEKRIEVEIYQKKWVLNPVLLGRLFVGKSINH